MTRALFAVLVFAAAAPAADPKAELKALSGTWEVQAAEIGGKDVLDSFKGITLTLANDTYAATVGTLTDKGTIAVDPGKSPKTMDITGTEGPNRGKTYPCLYELKEDTLTVCYGLDFKTRPAELKTGGDAQRMLVVYKRKK
jgi:uncharacterized protein (TIGR03067 family)